MKYLGTAIDVYFEETDTGFVAFGYLIKNSRGTDIRPYRLIKIDCVIDCDILPKDQQNKALLQTKSDDFLSVRSWHNQFCNPEKLPDFFHPINAHIL